MKEIKFRAWDKTNRKMINEVELLDLECGDIATSHLCTRHKPREDEDKIRGEWVAGEEVVIMQYTGLKDKNEEEIYEGDIIKTFANGRKRTKKYEVRFVNCGFYPFNSYDFDDFATCEVIGNIYENSDLLK